MGSLNEESKLENGEDADTTTWFQNIISFETPSPSPIDINLSRTMELDLPKLEWFHFEDVPKKIRLTNSGYTLILTGKWYDERPYIIGGPLSDKYVFSQLHFHWGRNDGVGSEHTVDGCKFPMEMHAVFYKSDYNTQTSALKEKDGITIISYFYKLQSAKNPSIEHIIDSILTVQDPQITIKIDPVPLDCYIKRFELDYFIYWGSIITSISSHCVLWIVSRIPLGITPDEVDSFRGLLDVNEEELVANCRPTQPIEQNQQVFHVCPSAKKNSTLLALP